MTKTERGQALKEAGFHQVAHFMDENFQTYHFPREKMDEPNPEHWTKEYSTELFDSVSDSLRLTGYTYHKGSLRQSNALYIACGSISLRTMFPKE